MCVCLGWPFLKVMKIDLLGYRIGFVRSDRTTNCSFITGCEVCHDFCVFCVKFVFSFPDEDVSNMLNLLPCEQNFTVGVFDGLPEGGNPGRNVEPSRPSVGIWENGCWGSS